MWDKGQESHLMWSILISISRHRAEVEQGGEGAGGGRMESGCGEVCKVSTLTMKQNVWYSGAQ